MEFDENKMDIEFENPWNVEDLDEFLYYCCPECNKKTQSKESFLQHAIDRHPLGKFSLKISLKNNILSQEFLVKFSSKMTIFKKKFQ